MGSARSTTSPLVHLRSQSQSLLAPPLANNQKDKQPNMPPLCSFNGLWNSPPTAVKCRKYPSRHGAPTKGPPTSVRIHIIRPETHDRDQNVSRPEIIHGSTSGKDGKSGGVRWVVNPWFVGIQADQETTDIPESGSWSTIASYHRSLEAPKTTPSGQTNSHGYPIKRFAASIPLRHICHISDALVGLTRWDDPMVKRELAWGVNIRPYDLFSYHQPISSYGR